LPVKLYDRIQLLAEPAEEVLQRLGVDFRHIHANSPDGYEERELIPYSVTQETANGYASGDHQHTFVDEWGVTFRRAAFYYDMIGHPLQGKSLEEVRQYKFPDPHDAGRWRGVRARAKDLYENSDYAIVCSLASGGILELSHFLYGFEDSLFHLGCNDKMASHILDSTTDWLTAFWEHFVETVWPYAHVIKIGDDYGMQDRMLMSPSMWRQLVKPRYARLIAAIKTKGDVKVLHHSCGAIFPIVGDLADIGVDILNPIQPLAQGMDSEKLKAKYGHAICFHGGVDVQQVLPFGSPDDVREEVRRRITRLADGGGYILAPAHNIQADVPVENILALFQAAQEWGRYPIGD
jgi:uroporphyrinogen decarboxylase